MLTGGEEEGSFEKKNMEKKKKLLPLLLWISILSLILGYILGRVYESQLSIDEWAGFSLLVAGQLTCLTGLAYLVLFRRKKENADPYV